MADHNSARPQWLPDVIGIAGFGLIVAGVCRAVSIEAGMIVAGVIMFAMAALMARR